jgi:hypothetical protein
MAQTFRYFEDVKEALPEGEGPFIAVQLRMEYRIERVPDKGVGCPFIPLGKAYEIIQQKGWDKWLRQAEAETAVDYLNQLFAEGKIHDHFLS